MMVFTGKIAEESRAFVRYAKKCKGMKQEDIMRELNISRSSVYRILKRLKKRNSDDVTKTKKPMGRPRKLSARVERLILRQIKDLRQQEGNFTIKRVMERSGVSTAEVSCRTVQRMLESHGYRYVNARQKGILSTKDFRNRFHFAKNMKKKYNSDFWTDKVAFFLDGVSFIHKFNPADQARALKRKIWRKRNEGLAPGCTAKGSHCGTGGRVAKFFVAISYGKGVILCEQYDVLNGPYFKDLIEREFPRMFRVANKRGSKIFIQDGDPSQNSAPARAAWKRIGAKLISIPPRSPDINVIESLFHIVKVILREQALKRNITYETFAEFSLRVMNTIKSLDHNLIDKTISSMSKRIDLIVGNKGLRTNY